MTVYSFDKEFAVETKKSVNIGGQVQTINFTDSYIKKVNKIGIAIDQIVKQLDVDTDHMSEQAQDRLLENSATKLRDTAIKGLNELLDGRGQELYKHYGQNTNVMLNIIRFLQTLAESVVKDQKTANKSK